MPPSGRKGKTRVKRPPAAETHEASEAETPEAIPTPSKPTRKRARVSENNVTSASRNTRRKTRDTRAVDREDTEGTEAQDASDVENDPAVLSEQNIIAHLKVADRHVNATEDFANDLLEGQENVPGYGKIAGSDWAFIIRKVEVNIGRPETQEKLAVHGDGGPVGPTAKTIVDIDLGPDRQVSRSHAIISYDSDQMAWLILVNGRNGLRLDNTLLKRGMKAYLRNGSVIEIAGTQMAFITSATEDNEGPQWHGSILRQAQKSSEDDEDQDDGNEESRAANDNGYANSGTRTRVSGSNHLTSDLTGEQQRQQPNSSQQQHKSHAHSSQAAAVVPGTPMRSQRATIKSSPAANYARGVLIESTESIDYSADSARDLKPPHSYAQLIGMAILSTPEQQMTLNNIYKWIMGNYAFYRFKTDGWQNSIRHNLSLNKAFTKIARRTDEPGKGMKWMIEPSEFENFVQQGMKGCRRPNAVSGNQSNLGSPSSPANATRPSANGVRTDHELSPPFHAYRPAYSHASEAFTPDRGPKRQNLTQSDSDIGLGIKTDRHDFTLATRSTPRNGMTAASHAAGSPPALYVNDDGRTGPLDTPFPLRPSQRLAPPSTLKRPSDFIQFSSPAPFWKMEGLVGSTPFKPYDLSPIKTPFSSFKKNEDEDEEDKKDLSSISPAEEKIKVPNSDDGDVKPPGSPFIHSSSPPRLHSDNHGLDASPTVSRPNTGAGKIRAHLNVVGRDTVEAKTESTSPVEAPIAPSHASTETPPLSAGTTSAPINHAIPASNVTANGHPHGYPVVPHSIPSGTYPNGNFPGDDGEDEGIDLAKGFQPIGTFHQRNHLTMSMGVGTAPAFGR